MNRGSIFTFIGLLLVAFGVAVILSWSPVYEHIIRTELPLTPTSKSFALWRDTPIPITIDFYFFNWTNTDELFNDDFKPNLVEMGPYRFREVHEKVNLTWNDNDTITFRQIRRWYFDADNSNGLLEDSVTTLNPISLSATSVSRFRSTLMLIPLSSTLRMTGQKVWVTKTVGELLFDGYSDPILTLAINMPNLAQVEIPTDKFGWFYKRNGSADFEGVFNMETGAHDISKVGKLSNWNYNNRTKFYEAQCGIVKGSAGELFPPDRNRDTPLELFSSDLCRSITFDYAEDTEIHSVPGYRYILGKRLVDNGTVDPENWCNCGGECVPVGAINVSMCRHGAPAFVSYPHYLDADPFYTNKLRGMNPDPDKHRFYLTIEPKTGIPLDVAARLQINLLLQPSNNIAMYYDVPTIFFPMMWFEERATISEELAAQLSLLLMLPVVGLYLSLVFIILGSLLFGFGVIPKIYRSRRWTLPSLTRKNVEKKPAKVMYSKEQIRPLVTNTDKISTSPEVNPLMSSKSK